MSQFKGIFQVTGRKYRAIVDAGEAKGYLFLVREGEYLAEGNDAALDKSKPITESIYFGSRIYANNSVLFERNIKNAFGGLLDAEGGFIFPADNDGDTFANVDETKVDNLLGLLQALDAAITANKEKFADYYTENEIDTKVKDLQDAIALCVKSVSVKVGDTSYSGVMGEKGAVEIDLSDAFEAAGKVKDVTVDGVSVMNGTTAVIDLSGKANVGVVNGLADRIATLEGVEHAKDVTYDSTAKTIYLIDKDGNKFGNGFDASDFLVDGMLDSVEFEEVDGVKTNNLVFTFNTASGKESFTIDFSKYVDTYHADGTSIELDSATNTFSLKSADADLVQVDAIPVGGTPLAEILLENDITGITAGNLQTVLEALFSQNNWAQNPRRNIPDSLTVSMGNPSISYDLTGTQEVGTEVKLSASAANASASATLSYSGFTYGYSVDNDNTKDNDGDPASVTISGTKDTDSNYKLEFTINSGFTGGSVATVNAQSTTGNSLVVAEGTNKVTVKAYSPTFSGTVPAQNAVYACSSLNKTDDEHVVAASEESTISGSVKTASKDASVTGAYYAFVGFSDTLPTTNDEYRAFIGNGFTRLGKGSVAAGTCNKTYMAVCIPSNWDFTCNTSLGADMRNSFTETGDVTITLPNGATKAYKYYALTYKDGAFKDLVIK